MPLLENLAEGFANAAGATGAVEGIEKNKANRRGIQEAELKSNLDTYNQALASIQQKMSAYHPESKEYKQLAEALQKTISARTALFHPEHGPAAMSKLAELLHLKAAANVPANAGDAKASMAEALAAGAPQGEYSDLSPDDATKARRIKYGLEPRAVAEKDTATKYQAQLTETTDEQGVKHYWRVPLEAGAPPEEVDFKGQKVTPKGKSALISKFQTEVNAYRTTHKIPEDEPLTEADISYINQKAAHDARVSGSSTAVRFEKNDKNEIVPVEYQTTRGVGPEPADPRAAKPTPGQLKKDAKKVATSSPSLPAPTTANSRVKVGTPIMTAANPAANKADTDYDAAVKVDKLATQAQESHDPVQQRQLALALIKAMAGRVNMQEFEQYTKNMGVPNTVEGLINGLSTGEMPSGIVDSLVKAAHANLEASKAEKAAAHGATSDSDEDAIIKALNGGK